MTVYGNFIFSLILHVFYFAFTPQYLERELRMEGLPFPYSYEVCKNSFTFLSNLESLTQSGLFIGGSFTSRCTVKIKIIKK